MIPIRQYSRFLTRSLLTVTSVLFFASSAESSVLWELNATRTETGGWQYAEILSGADHHVIGGITRIKGEGTSALVFYRLSVADGSAREIWRSRSDGDVQDFCFGDADHDGDSELMVITADTGVKKGNWFEVYDIVDGKPGSRPSSALGGNLGGNSGVQPLKIYFDTFENGRAAQPAILFGGSLRKIYTFTMEGRGSTALWKADREIYSAGYLSGNEELGFIPFRLTGKQVSDFLMYRSSIRGTGFRLIALDKDGKSREIGAIEANAEAGSSLRTMSSGKSSHGSGSHIFYSTESKNLGMVTYNTERGLHRQFIEINHGFAPETVIDNALLDSRNYLFLGYDNTQSLNVYELKDGEWITAEQTGTDRSGQRAYGTLIPDEQKDRFLTVTSGRNRYIIELTDLSFRTKNTSESDPDTLQAEVKAPGQEVALPGTGTGIIIDEAPAEPDLTEDITYKIGQYDYVFTVNDTFTQNIPLGSIDPGKMQISWDAPEGATFNIQTGDINWDILDDQLDERIFDLDIYSGGDTASYYWNIYVNDIPRIVNSQRTFTVGLNEPWSLQIEVEDLNNDPEIRYWIDGLGGAGITETGLVTWNPGESYLDINIFTVTVSDGFAVTEEKFMVYVNDPVRIISRPPSHILRVDEVWQYQVVCEDRNEANLFQITFSSPDILQGYEAQIRKFMDAEKVSVETEGRGRVFKDVRANVYKIQILDNKLFLTLNNYNEDIKFTEYLSGILDLDYNRIPRYGIRQIKQLHYTLAKAAGDAQMTKEGLVTWKPGKDDLDEAELEVEVSDIISRDRQYLNLYVNYPPRIISPARPVVLGPGQLLTYHCVVEDLNREPKISFRLSDDSPPADLDDEGHVVWKVRPGQYDYDQLTLIADDGYDEDEVTLMMYVNDPVRAVNVKALPAQVEKVWKQELMYKDRNKNTLYRIVVEDPEVFTDIRDRIQLFMGRHSVPVIRPDGEGKGTEVDVRPAVKNLFTFGSSLFVELAPEHGDEAGLNEIFAGVMERPVEYLPRHRKFHDKKISFKALIMPPGMNLSEEGILTWIPTATQVDTFRVKVEISDAIAQDTVDFKVFSNSPPEIVSKAPGLVHVGDVWSYPIEIHDLNRNQPYSIKLVNGPEDMVLKNSILTWKPSVKNKGNNTVSYIVSDGHQNTAQTFNIFVNAAPEITSKPVIVGLTGFSYSYQIKAEDPNGDEIQFKAVELPQWATLDEKTGLITWEPRSSERGINRFVIDVRDSRDRGTEHKFDVQVYEDPAAKKFSLAVFPVMVTFVGVLLMAALL